MVQPWHSRPCHDCPGICDRVVDFSIQCGLVRHLFLTTASANQHGMVGQQHGIELHARKVQRGSHCICGVACRQIHNIDVVGCDNRSHVGIVGTAADNHDQ